MSEELRILMLEDNLQDAKLIEHHLRKGGLEFRLKRVETKDDFIRELEEFLPSVILSEYVLSSFDGLSALRIAQERYPYIPFILVSGKHGEEMAVNSLKNGATDYLIKNNLAKLSFVVKRALQEVKAAYEVRKAQEELRQREERLRFALQAREFGVWEFNSRSREWFQSLLFKQIFGYEHFKGDFTYKMFIEDVFLDDRQRVEEKFNEAAENAKELTLEFRFRRKDGAVRWIWMLGRIESKVDEEVKMAGLVKDITETKKIEEDLAVSLREKDMLLMELHHRVKNNLQLISSLLQLQQRYIKDEHAVNVFKESQNRIMTIAVVHEEIYHSKDFANVDLKEYLVKLTKNLSRFYQGNSDRIKLTVSLENIVFGIERAVSCGLLVNELLSNTFKYAFPNQEKGEVRISLKPLDQETLELVFSDNGVGVPQDVDFLKAGTLGFRLVHILAEKQLNGTVELKREGGTLIRITFKKS